MQNGKRHGKGILIYPSGAYCEGDWFDDKQHGIAKDVTLDTDGSILEIYEGGWVLGDMEGYGKFKYQDGNCYEGAWLQGKRHGRGRYTCQDGSFYEGEWRNGIAFSNASNLKEELFFNLLCKPGDSLTCEPPEGYCLGILVDYLQKRGYVKISSALKEAYRIFLLDGAMDDREIDQMFEDLTHGVPLLFSSGTFEHAIGIRLSLDSSSQFVICEIFNTGEGLDFHRKHPQDPRKFQTMQQVKIPIASISKQLIEDFSYRFSTVEYLYEMIYNLPGAKVLVSDSIPWQTMQKGNDCSLRWILAFCKNQMPEEEYKNMLAQLKLDCQYARAYGV